MSVDKIQHCSLPSNISNNESIAISLLRATGVLMIVICHIYQSLDDNLCLLFNVGVQMFFFISGFLYGKKDINNIWSWFGKRAKRILVPYYVLIVSMLFFIITIKFGLLHRGFIFYMLNLQGFMGGGITALNHLWFISFIILCYVLTPLLQWIDKKNYLWLYTIVLLGCLGCRYLPYCSLANWTTCYVVGYILARRNWIYNSHIIGICILSCLILFLFINKDIFSYYSHYYLAWHYVVGISICVFILKMFNSIRQTINLITVVRSLDDYSYEIYLVNFIPLVGEFILIKYGPILSVNILLILSFIICAAIILKYISNKVNQVIDNKCTFQFKNKLRYERENYCNFE